MFREKAYVAILVGLVALALSSLLAATVARRSAALQLVKRVPVDGRRGPRPIRRLGFGLPRGKRASQSGGDLVIGSSDSWRLSPRLFAAARILFSFLLFLSVLSFLVEKRITHAQSLFLRVRRPRLPRPRRARLLDRRSVRLLLFHLGPRFRRDLACPAQAMGDLLAYVLMYVPAPRRGRASLRCKPDFAAYGRLIAPTLAISLACRPFPSLLRLLRQPPPVFRRPRHRPRKRAVLFSPASPSSWKPAPSPTFRVAVPARDPGVEDLIDLRGHRSGRGALRDRALGRSAGWAAETCSAAEFGSNTMHWAIRPISRAPDSERRIGITETASPFLDRVDEGIRIDLSAPPYDLEMSLTSADDIFLYDCSLPYKVAVDGKSAIIYAGVNPGPRLSFSITVPASFHADWPSGRATCGPWKPALNPREAPWGIPALRSGRAARSARRGR